MGREEGHVTVEAEIRVKPPQAKEQRDHLKPEVGREAPPLEPSGGERLLQHLDFRLPAFRAVRE